MNAQVHRNSAEIYQAVDYIAECCPRIESFHGTGEPHRFLAHVAEEIDASAETTLFPGRYKEHVSYALRSVAQNFFTTPPAAIGAFYLVTRFEFYFRILSGKLKANGEWVDPDAFRSAQNALPSLSLRKKGNSNVSEAYKIMMIDQSTDAVRAFAELDRRLHATPYSAIQQRTISDVGDRIGFFRNAAGHGELGDVSADSVFLGLLTAIVFYGQPY